MKMNKYLQDYLISPETGDPLLLASISENALLCGQLQGNNPIDIFNIVNEIPVLLKHNQVADYNHNIFDIIFKEKFNEIYNEIGEKHNSNYELFRDELDKYILDQYGKEGIIKAYEEYSKMPESQRLSWYAKLNKGQVNDNNSLIPTSALKNGISYATSEIGKKRIEMSEKMINKWACHLMDYGELVTENKSGIIVELATGAGLGTCGVVNSGLGNSKLISIDIDYAAAANAIGIAKYLGQEEYIDSLVANFWFLPLKNDCIDVVCSHYGLDEAREINSILAEISRILKVGGKFINVSRKDPTIRIRQTLGHLEFSEEEYMKLASYAGFYCGMDALKKVAEKNDFVLEYHKVYSPKNSHERIISVFKKI
jgi:ubiquinone/menaquinone biosynthesis C-methylase UbiE/uncharacterized protein YbaR (Trm112 family)